MIRDEAPALRLDKSFDPEYGQPVRIAPGVVRVTANNPGPYSFRGTNSYILGEQAVAVIDPGPEDDAHFQSLIAAIGGRPLTHILVTHCHADHSTLSRRLRELTGAPVLAEGRYRMFRDLYPDEAHPYEHDVDWGFAPDQIIADGDKIAGDGWTVTTISTPGHAARHSCFVLDDTGIIFTADHVMAWSSSAIAPPDGNLAAYMNSLRRMMALPDMGLLLPGHGGAVLEPAIYMRALEAHRLKRLTAVEQHLKAGIGTIPALLQALYPHIAPHLMPTAAYAVLALVEYLVETGRASSCDGRCAMSSCYEAVPVDR